MNPEALIPLFAKVPILISCARDPQGALYCIPVTLDPAVKRVGNKLIGNTPIMRAITYTLVSSPDQEDVWQTNGKQFIAPPSMFFACQFLSVNQDGTTKTYQLKDGKVNTDGIIVQVTLPPEDGRVSVIAFVTTWGW